jgi:hypothetical protein
MHTVALAIHHWYSLSWDQWIGVIGFPLTLLGLYFTWWQAKGASDTAKATQVAVLRTQSQLRANQLLVFVSQLRYVVSELDLAIAGDDPDKARAKLDEWRWSAGHIRGILIGADPGQEQISTQIQESIALASLASTSLLKGTNQTKTIFAVCSTARTAISVASDSLNVWVGQHSTQVPQGDHNG